MAWRRIVVDEQPYRWTTSVSISSTASSLTALRLTVIARTDTRRVVVATFHGFVVPHLWDGRIQNIVIRPSTVAALIRDGRARIDHAECDFPGAVTGADARDTALAAACAQWFVPYPGRAALEQALVDDRLDHAAAAARFGVTPAQIAHWAQRLGIRG
jgi:hypothetical protein